MSTPRTTRRTLAWFRDDLRLDDQHALHEAIQRGTDGFAAVFFATRDLWRRQNWGPPRIAMVEGGVNALAASITKLGGTLHVFECEEAEVPGLLRRLAEHWSVDEVHANREFGLYEDRRDERVSAALSKSSRKLVLHEDQTILPVRAIRSGAGTPYTVFTPFKRNWLKRLESTEAEPRDCPRPTRSLPPPPTDCPEVDIDDWPKIEAPPFPAGEAEPRRRFDAFLASDIDRYVDRRDLPAVEGTSTLSPWIACGSISPRRMLRGLRDRLGEDPSTWNDGASVWLSELVWREFYRHVMDGIPRLSMDRPLHGWTDAVAWRDAPEDYDAWRRGRTGIALVDAGMRQLAATGWMHNRVRMVVATFLTKHLLIDWRRGERFFMSSLADADFCSNNGGWQWAASTGTDAAPYFRVFNPDTQRNRFDKRMEFVQRWAPEHIDGTARPPLVDLKKARVRAIEAFKNAKNLAAPAT